MSLPQTIPSAIGSVTKNLKAFLMANTPDLSSCLIGWPQPNEKLDYPAISIFQKQPQFTALSPYIVHKATPDPTTNIMAIQKVVGMYDFSFQLDLWTAYRPQRDVMLENIIAAFNTNTDVPGIDLNLPDYYNETCHLCLDQIQYFEDEAAAQRAEWRVLITVLGNMRVVRPETGVAIVTVENNLDTSENTITADDTAAQILII